MNLQEFKNELENTLKTAIDFELYEFHYVPYSFHSGLLVYKINNNLYKFIYNGETQELEFYSAEPHHKLNKYKKWTLILKQNKLNLHNIKVLIALIK